MNVTKLFEPFEFAFFRNGFVLATLAGALCGMIGVYVVLRGMSYIGHGLSHAIFGGAAASSVLSFNYYLGAGIWGIASALAIGAVTRRRTIGSDAAIGVVTTASFAIGLALLARYGTATRSIDAVLFGSVLGVTTNDILVVAVVTVLAAVAILTQYRKLLFTTFDPENARASGTSTARVDAMFMIVLSISILVTMKVIGVLLIAAMLVVPPTIARLLTNRFSMMLVISTAIGAGSGAVGMIASYHLDISAGASIVLVSSTIFAVAFATSGLSTRLTRSKMISVPR